MNRFYRPLVEQLEDRLVPTSLYGVPWPNASQITLSFAPDGTQAGFGPSNLSQTLNAKAPTAAWQMEILRAFQTWAVNANINLSVVPDGGQPLGTAGAVQGDARFGDIRIAARPGAPGSTDIALSQPFSWTGTTWSGDVVLNSAQPIGIGNTSTQYDLFSIMLHEAGHVFGFGEDDVDAGSVMNSIYAPYSQLAPIDIAHLQSLYGAREPNSANDTLATATLLNNSLQGAAASGEVGSLQDANFYKLQTPGFLTGFTSFTVQLSTPSSLLVSNLGVYDGSGRLVGSATASDPLHGDLTLNINAKPGATYYLGVRSGTSSAFGVGSYQLSVTNHYGLISLGTVVNLTTAVVNNTLGTAQHLVSQNPGTDQRFDFYVQGSQSSSTGGEYYQMQSPAAAAGATESMAAIVWGLDVNGLQPRLHVFDANQNPVAAQVLANGAGTYTIQLPNAVPNASYYVEVTAANPGGANSTGRFALAVDFHVQNLVTFANLDGGTLTQAQAQATGGLTLADDSLFHFALSANSANANEWVTMTVLDGTGAVVLTLKVQAGRPTVTADVYLKKGTYSIFYAASTSDGSALSSITFALAGDILSDRVGAYTTPPPSSSAPPPQTSSSSPPPQYSYNSGSSGGSSGSSSSTTPPSSTPYSY